ncbi:MAG TPA: pyroglutamyl-peptidase I [Xanthobacteraceae bacterium]|nr:pyroglutamyl-peptidase I [Xanthobacteraceae bacterium]
MRVLLIGFNPFPGAPLNPSAALVEAMAHRRRPAFANIERLSHVFRTEYAQVDKLLPGLFALHPDIVLMFGLAGRRRQLSIETRARNAVSVLRPDAGGHRPQRGFIQSGGAVALRGAAPFTRLVGAVRGCAVPAGLSRDAGRYLCNYAYWRALERAPHGRPLVQFVHIPLVSLHPRPRRRGRRSPSFSALMTAAERLLIALLTASRR